MEQRKRRWGDRADGYKVREVNGSQNILSDLKPNRSEAEVYIDDTIDVTEFVKYMKKLKKDDDSLTYFHGFCMATAKMLYKYPYLNRFVQNRTLYMHNDVTVGFVAKAKFEDGAQEFLTVMKIEENDTIYDISKKLNAKIDKIRNKSGQNTAGANNVVDKIGKSWRPFRSFCLGCLKFIDRKWGLPASVAAENIYYSSMIVSNLGTFKVGGIYHNLTNLGTSSGLVTFGEVYEKDDRYFMEVGITLDERIADGYYFCKALKGMEYMFAHPELLVEPAAKDFTVDMDILQKKSK